MINPKYPFQISSMVGGKLPQIGQAVLQQRPQLQQQIQQPQSMGSRIQGILSTLLGAQDRSELSKGLLDFGSRMMAASAPGGAGSFFGALGQSLPATREVLEQRRQMGALDSFLPEDLRGLPPSIAIPLYQARNEKSILPVGAMQVDAEGNMIAYNPALQGVEGPDYADPGSYVREAMGAFGVPTLEEYYAAPPDVRAQIRDYARELRMGAARAGSGAQDPRQIAVEERSQKYLEQLDGEADGADQQLNMLGMLKSALQDETVYQGSGGGYVHAVKKLGQALGFDVQGVSVADMVNSLGSQLALYFRNPESGFGMPGSLSEGELKFLRAMVPGLGNSRDGNKLMVEALILLNQRKVALQQLYEQHYLNGGGRDSEWNRIRREFVEKNDFGSALEAINAGFETPVVDTGSLDDIFPTPPT